MTALIASFLLVFFAEMGDKTQLLAMAFAAKYNAYKVLIAVFIATGLINTFSVLVGRFLTTVVPVELISLIAALSFIVFGLWNLHDDKIEGEDRRRSRFGPIATVAIAFFLAEMGDKTQLATISLAIKYGNALAVLAGATIAMVAANAIGIGAGTVLRRYVSERSIKVFSSVLFILFGLNGIYVALSPRIGQAHLWVTVAAIGALALAAAIYISRKSRQI